MKQLIVTSYESPDLDGTACAYGYAELLQKQGTSAVAAISGTPHKEAQFVLRTFSIPALPDADALFSDGTSIILVDASDTGGLSPKLRPEMVTEIIDHRKITEVAKFSNAKAHIELVGSCATLIAEKFFSSQTEISREAAVLLYSAIISNTINFQANVTTDRDRRIADWLLTKVILPKNFIHDMFADKSVFDVPLRQVFDSDFAVFEFGGKRLGIMQLEIIDTEEFIEKNKEEISAVLTEMKMEKQLDYTFLTAIDLIKATNTFFAQDAGTETLVSTAVGVRFENRMARREGIMMRKTINPLLKAYLER